MERICESFDMGDTRAEILDTGATHTWGGKGGYIAGMGDSK